MNNNINNFSCWYREQRNYTNYTSVGSDIIFPQANILDQDQAALIRADIFWSALFAKVSKGVSMG